MANLHQCSICGNVDFWSDSWTSFTNILIEDYDSRLSIRTCSDECEKKRKSRVDAGKVVLPKVGMRGFMAKLIRKNKGYGRQPDQQELGRIFQERREQAEEPKV